jgi:hypothetical protein
MLGTIIIPFLFALVLPILLILVVFIPGLFLLVRWSFVLGAYQPEINSTGDMKVPTFYSSISSEDINVAAYIIMMSVVGIVFGGIHCIGWFFNFPSGDEAMLWRVSSAVPSVKMTAKDNQMYNNIYPTFYAQTTLECGLRHTPSKSHSVQSTHRMWPYIHLDIAMYSTMYYPMY